MAKIHILCSLVILWSVELSKTIGQVDIGTATMYGGPPYIPNACNFDEPQFPPGGTFASAGKEIWDDGAACGRTYQLKCASSASPGACLSDTVVVTIVDRALKDGWTLLLSEPAFHKIATKGTEYMNLELKLV